MMLRSNGRSLSLVPALALVLFALFVPAMAHASMYGSVVKYYGGGWPPWWSGTNCAVTATVGAGTPAWLAEAHMFIDGTEVRVYTDEGVHHAPYVVWTNIVFDSTHVADGSDIDFHLTGRNSYGQTLDYHQHCPAYNEAYVLGNSTLAYGVAAETDVGVQTAGMNHDTATSYQANRTTILSTIPAKTVFYIYTHAGAGWFNDCPNTSTVYAADVSTAVGNKTSSQPPYNVVHIDGCFSCGTVGNDDWSLALAFGITGTDDRAFIGWQSRVTDSSGNEQWSKQLWTDIKTGMTVKAAADHATGVSQPKNVDGTNATWRILGDERTTLHNTYFLGPTGQWHN